MREVAFAVAVASLVIYLVATIFSITRDPTRWNRADVIAALASVVAIATMAYVAVTL